MIQYALRSTFNEYYYTKNTHYVDWYEWFKYNDGNIKFNAYNSNSLWIYKVNEEIFREDSEDFRKAISI